MKDNKIRQDEWKNVIKIVKCLFEAKDTWLWYREIGRRCKLNHKTVSRLIDKYLKESVIEQEGVPPFLKIKMVRLKPGVSARSILNYLRVKRRIDNVRNSI